MTGAVPHLRQETVATTQPKKSLELISSRLPLMQSSVSMLRYKQTLNTIREGEAKLAMLAHNCPALRKSETSPTPYWPRLCPSLRWQYDWIGNSVWKIPQSVHTGHRWSRWFRYHRKHAITNRLVKVNHANFFLIKLARVCFKKEEKKPWINSKKKQYRTQCYPLPQPHQNPRSLNQNPNTQKFKRTFDTFLVIVEVKTTVTNKKN